MFVFVVVVETITYENTNEAARFPWYCDFGYNLESGDWCGIAQDPNDHQDWVLWKGMSPAPRTGPPENSLNIYGRAVDAYPLYCLQYLFFF